MVVTSRSIFGILYLRKVLVERSACLAGVKTLYDSGVCAASDVIYVECCAAGLIVVGTWVAVVVSVYKSTSIGVFLRRDSVYTLCQPYINDLVYAEVRAYQILQSEINSRCKLSSVSHS